MNKWLGIAVALALLLTALAPLPARAEAAGALEPGVPLELGGICAVTELSFSFENQIGYYRAGAVEVGGEGDYYRAREGTQFALLRVKIRNLSPLPIDFLEGCSVAVQDGGQRYTGWAYQQNPGNQTLEGEAYGADSGRQNRRWVISGSDGFAIEPQDMGWYVFGCAIDDASAGREGLVMSITLCGQTVTCRCLDDSSLQPVGAVQISNKENPGTETESGASGWSDAFAWMRDKLGGGAAPTAAPDPVPDLMEWDWDADDDDEDDEDDGEAEADPAEAPGITEWDGDTDGDISDDGEAVSSLPDIAEYAGGYAVTTSSVRVNRNRSIIVDGWCAVDGDLNTAWNSYNETAGAWISLSVQDGCSYRIAGFRIANGYWKSGKVYAGNSRPRTLDVYCDERYAGTFQLADAMDMQTFWFAEPVEAGSVRFVVGGAYGGRSYTDCAITEIELLGPSAQRLDRQSIAAWGRAVGALDVRIDQGYPVYPGEKGFEVLGLQILLRDGVGMLYGAADGDFGSMTRNAVNGLASAMRAMLGDDARPMTDGVVDRNYWQNLLAYLDATGGIRISTDSAAAPYSIEDYDMQGYDAPAGGGQPGGPYE